MKLKLKEGVQKFGSAKIWESMKQNLLGVEIDRNLIFDECVLTLFKQAKKTIHCTKIIKLHDQKLNICTN